MVRHTVTKREMQAIKIGHVMASEIERSRSKRLMFTYDIGRKRLEYIVSYTGDGDGHSTHDTLDEAIAAYNEL